MIGRHDPGSLIKLHNDSIVSEHSLTLLRFLTITSLSSVGRAIKTGIHLMLVLESIKNTEISKQVTKLMKFSLLLVVRQRKLPVPTIV